MKLPKFLISWLLKVHERAHSTPYFDLPGYMIRAWLLGYRSPERNTENPDWKTSKFRPKDGNWLYRFVCRHIAIRAHTILRSDQDRHLHDHPAWNLSIVLEGGYWEVCESTETANWFPDLYAHLLDSCSKGSEEVKVCAEFGIHWRGPGAVVFRRAETWHRLILPPNTVAKSIWAAGKKSNSWGFLTENGKVGWREYLGKGAMQ